jgi:anti-sigma factor RsiW
MAMIERLKSPDEDIEALLPWYEKGTLPESEARRVEQYLDTYPDRARYLAMIREEMAQTIECNEAAGMPSNAALNRLMESIAAEPKRRGAVTRERAAGLFARLFGAGPSWMPVAAAAACLVILVQAAALGVLVTRQGSGGPTLASGDPTRPVEAGSFAFVRFSPNATASDISNLLRSFNAVIVDGPKPGGVYRVRISSQKLANDQVEEILRQIRARSDIISFASVSG